MAKSRPMSAEIWKSRFGDWYVPEPNTGCWLWTRGENNGYGAISVNAKRQFAHRLAYEFWCGPIPDGLQLDHLCRQPLCVNPDHLEPVTQRENIVRGNGWAGIHARVTHCPNGHEYTPDNTKYFKHSRFCRECRRKPWRKGNPNASRDFRRDMKRPS